MLMSAKQPITAKEKINLKFRARFLALSKNLKKVRSEVAVMSDLTVQRSMNRLFLRDAIKMRNMNNRDRCVVLRRQRMFLMLLKAMIMSACPLNIPMRMRSILTRSQLKILFLILAKKRMRLLWELDRQRQNMLRLQQIRSAPPEITRPREQDLDKFMERTLQNAKSKLYDTKASNYNKWNDTWLQKILQEKINSIKESKDNFSSKWHGR